MKVTADHDLTAHNTLRLPARAQWWAQPASVAALQALVQDPAWQGLPRTVIGGGSNLVLEGTLPGLVIQPQLRGIRVEQDDGDGLHVTVGAGEDWDHLVAYTVAQGWSGLENLSLIPGTVGAAPVQNIGAYGVELCERLVSLEAVDLRTGALLSFDNAACRFGYRDSYFKREAPGRFAIVSVRLALWRKAEPVLHYADLAARFAALPSAQQNAAGVRELVCALRRSKLPDPAQLPNAGSFFKNPLVSAARFDALQAEYPGVPGHRQADGSVKLAAGWLIEQAGWKGRTLGVVGMHDRQALVLVNHGGADGAAVRRLAAQVAADVMARFGVALEQEPIALGQVLSPDAVSTPA